jgi:hypothetical protein
MDTRCLAWNVQEHLTGTFVGGPKFYLPYRCRETKLTGMEICAKCLRKKEGVRGNKNRPARWWGIVSDPIDNLGDQISHFAFSPWFMEWAKKRPLCPESMARAKKAIEKAREGIPNCPPLPVVPEIPSAVSEVAPPVAPPIQEPVPIQKKKPRVVQKLAPSETPAAPEKAKRKPRVAKKETPVSVAVQAILVSEQPLEAEEVLEVVVKPFEHAGNLYYIDTKKSKLYDRQKDGGCKGIYMGKWDSAVEKIVKDDDSDKEI